MEALFNKCAKISKKYAKKVVQEFDHPTCPSAKQGFTLYDFWNAATHQAKFMGDRQRETEKFAFQILNAKLPEETNPERARTEISD